MLGALDPVIATKGGANGVFVDFVGKTTMQNCRLKTCGEEKKSCCIFSAESEAAYNEGIKLALIELREQIHALDPSYMLIGNGLMNDDFNAGREKSHL